MEDPQQECLVLRETGEGDRIVAYGIISHAADEGEVVSIAVDPAYRRRGYGAALLQALFSAARTLGVRQIFLEVRVTNRPAIALYENCGFVQVGRRPNYYAALGEDALVYCREIFPPSNETR